VIFSVGLFGSEDRARQGHHELDRLAVRTGGLAYYPASVDDIGTVALEIARQIRNQYTIAYAPLNQVRYSYRPNNGSKNVFVSIASNDATSENALSNIRLCSRTETSHSRVVSTLSPAITSTRTKNSSCRSRIAISSG